MSLLPTHLRVCEHRQIVWESDGESEDEEYEEEFHSVEDESDN